MGIGIEEDFGHEALGIVARVEARIAFVGGKRFAGALVSGGLKNGAHERFEIVFVFDEKFGGGGEKFLITGRIGHAKVIDAMVGSVVKQYPQRAPEVKFGFDAFRQVYPLPGWRAAVARAEKHRTAQVA